MSLQSNITNRQRLIDTLKNELIGPIPVDETTMIGLDVDYEQTKDLFYSSSKETPRNHYFNIHTNDEIIHNGNSPITQYSTAILFPYTHLLDDNDEADTDSPLANIEAEENLVNSDSDIEAISKRHNVHEATEENNYSMNDKAPSSLAFTFYVTNEAQLKQLRFELSGGVYKSFNVCLRDKEDEKKKPYNTKWWNREKVTFTINRLVPHAEQSTFSQECKYETLQLKLQLNIRQINHLNLDGYFVTASLTNISNEKQSFYKNALFQTHVKVQFNTNEPFHPYPTSIMLNEHATDEDVSNSLLYYDTETYALGHGCSVNWDSEAKYIETTFLPEHEITNITPDIKDENGEDLKIAMLDLVEGDVNDIQQTLKKITTSYKKWIATRKQQIINYPANLHAVAQQHLIDCEYSLERMEHGISSLQNENILQSFKYANLAMFIQQFTGGSIQKAIVVEDTFSYEVDENTLTQLPTLTELKKLAQKSNKGYWRAFQISFLLMSLPSLPKEAKDERDIADLIWFPTGGGKTEAYLAVAATTILYRRLMNASDCGTEILMRYTLRLLTADQFQRSARLICALELIRKNHEHLFGGKAISIGLWVGKSNTPNKVEDAIKQLKNWKNTDHKKYAFLITHCPLCRCEMIRYEKKTRIKGKAQVDVAGYKELAKRGQSKEFVIHCPNNTCTFHEQLPIYLIDEQLYAKRPTFIIGTVDKFASLAWEPKARNIFGIDNNGKRALAPPSLIIQDELHLISGPLGSTVGIYETLIEELCTDYRAAIVVKPKIICATATVRGYKEQIQALFNRKKENIRLFPSPGLSHKDSFFAQVHMEIDPITKQSRPSSGRKYIGLASNLIGIQQLQVKAYTTVLQTAKQFDNPDPYWSLLAFYNSIRELGGSLTLFQTDISNYMLQFRNKHHITEQGRFINSIKELTSRLENREVTNALAELKTPYPEPRAIDVCLASNIIEVGVDVERLSLMSIVGQPKNTAQYIQVSGRVGRAWYERPGLVMTLYKLSMSRDKSHFEHFKEYHQNLYKQVEATSVTPFSEPSIDRALAGIVIAWLRQFGTEALGHSPVTIKQFSTLFDEMEEKIAHRLHSIDPSSMSYFKQKFKKIKDTLLKVDYPQWEQSASSNNFFCMYTYGNYVPQHYLLNTFPVLRSMRNVDASCIGAISNRYNSVEQEEEE